MKEVSPQPHPNSSPRTFKIAASAFSQKEKATCGAFQHFLIVVRETCSYKNVLHLYSSFDSTLVFLDRRHIGIMRYVSAYGDCGENSSFTKASPQCFFVVVHRALDGSAPGESRRGDSSPLRTSPYVITNSCPVPGERLRFFFDSEPKRLQLYHFGYAYTGSLPDVEFVKGVFFLLAAEEKGKDDRGRESYRYGYYSGVP